MAAKALRWPEWMGYPVVDDYRVEVLDRRTTTEMEVGAVSRVEFDTDESVATCSLFLKPFQANWFEAFERDLARQGTVWFTMPLWTGGRLLDHTVRFRERPTLAQKTGPYATYTFTLSVSKREGLIAADVAEILTELDPGRLAAMDDLLNVIVNDLLPASLPFGA